MAEASGAESKQRGRLLEHLMRFGRVLRAGGLSIGPGELMSAGEALRVTGIERREDFYWTLHAVFVRRIADRELFDRAFHVFWRRPRLLERLRAAAPPEPGTQSAPLGEGAEGLAAALAAGRSPPPPHRAAPARSTRDARLTWSPLETLRGKDFEQMSDEEVAQAEKAVAAMRPHLPLLATRRRRVDPRGRHIDLRATLRAALRAGRGGIPLVRARPGRRPAPVVLICDVSGSMSRYSSLLLHFAHALARGRKEVHAFVFGTRLTNVSPHLRQHDASRAMEAIARAVRDWDGGTRIGRCLREFNHAWSRRVLGPGALVLLVSDGLDRDVGEGLSFEMERLQKSCRRLLWLNPLLRYPGFEPRARGMQAMLPFVHELRSVHNLDSVQALGEALAAPSPREGWPPAARDAVRQRNMV